MAGQGSPRTSRKLLGQEATGWAVCRRVLFALWAWGIVPLALLACAPDIAVAESMRIRVAWGGGSARLWEGTIALDGNGTLSEPLPLGIEADEPGSMWIDQGRLIISQRSPRTYDGVDLLVTASSETKLLITLTPADAQEQPIRVEVSLATLAETFSNEPLDTQGNRLLVRREPGDMLRVQFDRDMLVFTPSNMTGERRQFRVRVEPHLLPVVAGTKVRITARLIESHGKQVHWASQERMVEAGRPDVVSMDVDLPVTEGPYDLVITAMAVVDWSRMVSKPLDWNKPIAQRTVQLLVLDGRGPNAIATPPPLVTTVEVDPVNPNWLNELLAKVPQLPSLPHLRKATFGNDQMRVRQYALGQFVELSPNRDSPDVSWQAFTLPIKRPGVPHILEITYPSDVPQTLGISVLEPNAAGALLPVGLDSGIDTPKDASSGRPTARLLKHRLVFWPRTETPIVLLTNRRRDTPAVYGKMRVLSGWDHLPQALGIKTPGTTLPTTLAATDKPMSQRLLAAYFDRPLFPENFSAKGSLDVWVGRSLDDWRTFHDGGTRLIEYLRYVGYNGLMLSVLADGSTLYPSDLLQPTPRYDTGIFFSSGRDPMRKDVLEMLLTMFDREQLQLIPTLHFAASLPALERRRREGTTGIEWIGPDGATWSETYPSNRPLSQCYNILQPEVQEAMLDVVREVVERYALRHPSFTGLAIQLSPEGYAQLPPPQWGMDDMTIARFERDTKLKVPGTGPNRFARRAEFLLGTHEQKWLAWRAATLASFYRRVHAELTAVRPECRLYLATVGSLSGSEMEKVLRPTLTQRRTIADAMLQIGIDASLYRQTKGLVLLRPELVLPTGSLGPRAVDLQLQQTPDIDDYFNAQPTAGSLFFHPPQEVHVESFDKASPFKTTYTGLTTQCVPSAEQNRRRFVHSLATLDSQVLVDGGWMLALGQEEALHQVIAAYRALPAVQFNKVVPTEGDKSSQPLTFRYCTHQGKTYVYVVNDAPFATTGLIRIEAPAECQIEELSGLRPIEKIQRDTKGAYWVVAMQPYDMVAVRFSTTHVTLSRPRVPLAASIQMALGQRIREWAGRTARLCGEEPLPLNVLTNPGFETAGATADPLPGWHATRQAQVIIRSDTMHRHSGDQSVKMSTTGPWASLVSEPFRPPSSGRVWLRVWLRVADKTRQPHLQMTIGGTFDGGGEYYHAPAPVGASPVMVAETTTANSQTLARAPIGTEWGEYLFPIDDLPLKGLSELQVRFDLRGPGEVWIDDVQITHPRFTKAEAIELTKLNQLAYVTLETGRVSDCMQLLDGYWPRFLAESVPLTPGIAARRPTPTRQPVRTTSRVEPGILDGMRTLLPKALRF